MSLSFHIDSNPYSLLFIFQIFSWMWNIIYKYSLHKIRVYNYVYWFEGTAFAHYHQKFIFIKPVGSTNHGFWNDDSYLATGLTTPPH